MREGDIPSAAAPPPEFAFALARVAVAQICQSVGYDGAQRPALEALADVAARYLKSIAKSSAESANFSGRTESNLFDVIAAIEELRSVQGFGGSWRVRSRCLWRSAAIKDLIKFFKFPNRIPFAQPLPPRIKSPRRERVSIDSDINSGWYGEGRTKHVPRWLPAAEEAEGSEAAGERTEEVKWECGKREEGADLGEIEIGMKKMKRGCDDEFKQVLYSKRVRVRSGNPEKEEEGDDDDDEDEDTKELAEK